MAAESLVRDDIGGDALADGNNRQRLRKAVRILEQLGLLMVLGKSFAGVWKFWL